ncbi:unnamed protein product, partial [Brassica oleracea]
MVLCRVIGFLVAKERNEFLMLSFVKATKERSTDMQPADMMHHSGCTILVPPNSTSISILIIEKIIPIHVVDTSSIQI